MINIEMVDSLMKAYREDESCIAWLRSRIRTAPIGIKTDKIEKDLELALRSKKVNRSMLDQYYINGITSEKIEKDIQR